MFSIDVDWHKLTTPKIECPNCGEKIKEGIAFHYSNGRICVLSWERAYLAGAVKKDEVPESFRWWVDTEITQRGPGRSPKHNSE
jgi:ribosomal protein S27AE